MRMKGFPELPQSMIQEMTRKEAARIVNRFGGFEGASNGSYEMRLKYLMLCDKYGEESEKVDDWIMYWRRELNALVKYHTPQRLWEKMLSKIGIHIKI